MSRPDALPKVIATSVIRSSHQGESHGGLYLVDMETGDVRQLLDWNALDISWEGRGGDRGLRGIAFWRDQIILAASDEIFYYSFAMERLRSERHRYLKHCHEIQVDGDDLLITSTGFDSILRYSLADRRFIAGYCIRYRSALGRRLKRVGIRTTPAVWTFDPHADGGPTPADTTHINHVWPDRDGSFWVSGTHLGYMMRISKQGTIVAKKALPFGTHNARPWDGGILANFTRDEVTGVQRGPLRRITPRIEPPVYRAEEMTHTNLPQDHARPAFARGLAVHEDAKHGTIVAVGSSPATISLYRLEDGELLRRVQITDDVRNAIHGLEIYPA